MEIQNSYPKTSFNGRCVQIRDAQWVCHIINTTFPHTSTSKLKPSITKLLQKTFPEKMKRKPENMLELYEILKKLELSIGDIEKNKNYSFTEKLARKISMSFLSPKKKSEYKILKKCRRRIDKFGNIRIKYDKTNDREIFKSLRILEKHKQANCLELATLAEFVLKLNGIEKATTAFLLNTKNLREIDHAVCAFNIDGKVFDGKMTNKTIIIDPWAGIADFAKNIKIIYKNTMKNFLDISDDTDICFQPIRRVYLTCEEMYLKETQYPQLIFKNKHREFMHK